MLKLVWTGLICFLTDLDWAWWGFRSVAFKKCFNTDKDSSAPSLFFTILSCTQNGRPFWVPLLITRSSGCTPLYSWSPPGGLSRGVKQVTHKTGDRRQTSDKQTHRGVYRVAPQLKLNSILPSHKFYCTRENLHIYYSDDRINLLLFCINWNLN